MIGDAVLLNAGSRARRIAITVAFAFVLLAPAYHHHAKLVTARGWFEVGAAIVMTGLCAWVVNFTEPTDDHPRPEPIVAVLALGIALFAVGGENWLGALAIAAALAARSSRSARMAALSSAACIITGAVVASVHHYSFGNTVAPVLTPLFAGLFAYSVARRMETLDSLRRTRAELARAAAAEERLRIARDLHDLLGHSLSLITIKAELAGRLMQADPNRAAKEIADLESVARQSLSDVREAVAGFRQPDLAGELVAARQLLDAAGISTEITAADTDGLARDVDSALAWAVREGATNVVRHSRATHVAIKVSRSPAEVMAEVRDNGPAAPEGNEAGPALPAARTAGPDGRAALTRARPVFGGSGLAGLAERVRSLGGELAAGSTEPKGFLLRVVVPLRPQASE
jgi:two-component system, NarL family, sensor histidine kinase DesK